MYSLNFVQALCTYSTRTEIKKRSGFKDAENRMDLSLKCLAIVHLCPQSRDSFSMFFGSLFYNLFLYFLSVELFVRAEQTSPYKSRSSLPLPFDILTRQTCLVARRFTSLFFFFSFYISPAPSPSFFRCLSWRANRDKAPWAKRVLGSVFAGEPN